MSKEQRAAARRAHILQVAGKVFLERGFAGASMGDIAAAGAGSKGTLYLYFSSKEELFQTFMVSEILARATQTFDPIDYSTGVKAVLSLLGERYVRLTTDPTAWSLLRTVIYEVPRFPEIGRIFDEAGPKPAKKRLGEYFERNITAGKLTISDVPMAVDQFLMLCKAKYHFEFMIGVRGAPTDVEIKATVDAAINTFLAAYATDRCD